MNQKPFKTGKRNFAHGLTVDLVLDLYNCSPAQR